MYPFVPFNNLGLVRMCVLPILKQEYVMNILEGRVCILFNEEDGHSFMAVYGADHAFERCRAKTVEEQPAAMFGLHRPTVGTG